MQSELYKMHASSYGMECLDNPFPQTEWICNTKCVIKFRLLENAAPLADIICPNETDDHERADKELQDTAVANFKLPFWHSPRETGINHSNIQ